MRPPRPPSAAALLVLAVAPLPAVRAQTGLTFTYRVQSTAAARARGPASPNLLATVRMAGGNARVDFREGGLPAGGRGSYLLIRGAERQLVLVNPEERQAVVLTPDALGGLGALTDNALVKVRVRDPHFAFEELGASEHILGQPTRRVRVRSGATTEVRVLGRTERTVDSTVTEVWLAPRPTGLDAAALEGWGRAFGGAVRRAAPELAPQMAGYERAYRDGLALRSVAVAQVSDGRGRTTVDTVRTEVTELARGRFDPGVFAVPAGYQTVDAGHAVAGLDSARRANGDTGSLGDAVRKAANESVRENATQGVRDAVGGLFRRRRP